LHDRAPADIPRGPFWLGWAGVIPFAALSAATVVGWPSSAFVAPALVTYGCVILSFMGGAQWGLATRAPQVAPFAWAVVPALVAWPILFLQPRLALVALAIAFAALCAYDLWTVRAGFAPPWYGRLRLHLTVAVVLLLVAAAAASPMG
jgi:hypothetical protein